MSNLPLGEIITTEQHRDAIHVAVAPVTAEHRLPPGTHVRLSTKGEAITGRPADCIGIVDPFLRESVEAGQRFWLFLYPGTITSLRHDWTHPAFARSDKEDALTLQLAALKPFITPDARESEMWVRAFAARVGLDYEELMDAAAEWVDSQEKGNWGAYLNKGDQLDGECVPDEFWPHYEKIKGITVPEKHRGSFFTCTC